MSFRMHATSISRFPATAGFSVSGLGVLRRFPIALLVVLLITGLIE